jgi:hypothetical protein
MNEKFTISHPKEKIKRKEGGEWESREEEEKKKDDDEKNG